MFFFFNDTATTEIYTLSLHDALPILAAIVGREVDALEWVERPAATKDTAPLLEVRNLTAANGVTEMSFTDRKSTRLNSSHANISYAVFCLKKKKYYLLTLLLQYNSLC